VPLALPLREPSIDRGIDRRIAMARQIWEAARDARGSPVERYLANRRPCAGRPPAVTPAASISPQ
jgi:hypothetical protein